MLVISILSYRAFDLWAILAISTLSWPNILLIENFNYLSFQLSTAGVTLNEHRHRVSGWINGFPNSGSPASELSIERENKKAREKSRKRTNGERVHACIARGMGAWRAQSSPDHLAYSIHLSLISLFLFSPFFCSGCKYESTPVVLPIGAKERGIDRSLAWTWFIALVRALATLVSRP